MKLFFTCSCGKVVYLRSRAETRYELSNNLGGRMFNANCTHCPLLNYVDVNYVEAEPTINKAVPGALGGGLILGLLGGPVGLLVGLISGGAIGGKISHSEREAVDRFNNNYL